MHDGGDHETRFWAKIATNDDERRAAAALCEASYRSVGYLVAEAVFDVGLYDREMTRPILVGDREQPIAAVRVCLFDAAEKLEPSDRLPSAVFFPAEVARALIDLRPRGAAVRAAEITKLARRPDYDQSTAIIFELFRLVRYVVIDFDADILFASVSRQHEPFYCRLGFRRLAPPRAWPGLHGVEGAPMACPRDRHEAAVARVPSLRTPTPEILRRFIGGEPIGVDLDLSVADMRRIQPATVGAS